MVHLHYRMIAAFLLASAAIAMAQSDARQKAEADLLHIHQDDRRAHFQRNVNAVLTHAGSQVVDVRDGKVRVMSVEEVRSSLPGTSATSSFQHGTMCNHSSFMRPTMAGWAG
jgi:hypothetical protein